MNGCLLLTFRHQIVLIENCESTYFHFNSTLEQYELQHVIYHSEVNVATNRQIFIDSLVEAWARYFRYSNCTTVNSVVFSNNTTITLLSTDINFRSYKNTDQIFTSQTQSFIQKKLVRKLLYFRNLNISEAVREILQWIFPTNEQINVSFQTIIVQMIKSSATFQTTSLFSLALFSFIESSSWFVGSFITSNLSSRLSDTSAEQNLKFRSSRWNSSSQDSSRLVLDWFLVSTRQFGIPCNYLTFQKRKASK
ncbi:Hypothetical_protein [Hexamita inflata]|uniref:Hypothetical_protein n=1 Tax=Hexamita inflata TaxID=28002 RepID=A0AA86NHV4_9EUKA|nr:Hypothetical protein HINF_LOCUS7243 [Hexamita inflata]